MSMHLSDDQLVDRLYGIAMEGDAHLDACPECQSRWSRVQQRRDAAVVSIVLPAERIHQQRREVQKRLAAASSNRPMRVVLVPAMFAVLLMVGLMFTRSAPEAPAPTPIAAVAPIVEVGWFEDAYSITREMEPRAASPIRHLFEAEAVSQ